VAVISEDLGNPVSDAVKRWCENEGIPVTQQCLDLPETIERLASAHAVAAGRGTFVPALVYLFPGERELTFSNHQTSHSSVTLRLPFTR